MSAAPTMPLTAIENPGQDLARQTVQIKIQRARLGNSRKVSAAQVEVDTDKTVLRISKRLFDCPEYKAIANFDAEISRYLESKCLPFEKGVHLCPWPLLGEVDRKLKGFARRTAGPRRSVSGGISHDLRSGARAASRLSRPARLSIC